MSRSYDIIGPRTPEGRKEIEGELQTDREEGRFRAGAEKTPEHLRVIRMTNEIVRRSLSDLGMESSDLAPEQVHLLGEQTFAEFTERPTWELAGFARISEDAIYVRFGATSVERDMFHERLEREQELRDDAAIGNADEEAVWELGLAYRPEKDSDAYERYNAEVDRIIERKHDEINQWAVREEAHFRERERYRLLNTMVHEAIHLQAFQRFYGHTSSEGITSRRGYRTGYDYYRDGEQYFVSLNEAITQRMTDEAIHAQRATLKAEQYSHSDLEQIEDAWSKEEARQALEPAYADDQSILNHLMVMIAHRNGETVEDVWRRFQTSYLTGEMMHLRDIERTFGRGALRFYAGIMPSDLTDRERRALAWQYFNATGEDERESARVAFSERQGQEDEEDEGGA